LKVHSPELQSNRQAIANVLKTQDLAECGVAILRDFSNIRDLHRGLEP